MTFKTLMVIGMTLIFATTFASATEKKHEGAMDMKAMMEVYTKLATPGPAHQKFAKMSGSWNTKTRAWMDPQMPPMESTGRCEQKMVLDGRFLHQECSGDFMGSPFTGMGYTGYDNHTKQYVSIWMDSMGTGMYLFEGTGSADGKSITQTTHYDDPLQGPTDLRSVTKFIDANSYIFEMYSAGKGGKETRMMEITYSRNP